MRDPISLGANLRFQPLHLTLEILERQAEYRHPVGHHPLLGLELVAALLFGQILGAVREPGQFGVELGKEIAKQILVAELASASRSSAEAVATKLGLIQTLVVGMPSSSAFARIFQFGMRHGMRPYTMGSAWWIGDCGPFWGHNALVRIAPFRDHCHLPVLPGGPKALSA